MIFLRERYVPAAAILQPVRAVPRRRSPARKARWRRILLTDAMRNNSCNRTCEFSAGGRDLRGRHAELQRREAALEEYTDPRLKVPLQDCSGALSMA